jgi:DeoR/GlpR family transcriptional regulator of sugar metabolism
VDLEGVTNSVAAEALVKRAAIARAERTILLADHTKLNRREGSDVCAWDAIHSFITNRHPAAAADPYRDHVRGIEICPPGADRKGKPQ